MDSTAEPPLVGRAALIVGGDPAVAKRLAEDLADASLRVAVTTAAADAATVVGETCTRFGRLDAVVLNPGASWRDHAGEWLECLHTAYAWTDRSDGVMAALGEPGHNVAGFRRTHERAALCRQVMQLSDARPGRVQTHSRVALASVLTADVEQMREFVREELGALTADDDATATLRATLTIYLDEAFSAARTGRRVGIHTNTVNYRVRRCAELRGRPVRERRVELELALLLRQALRSVSFEDD